MFKSVVFFALLAVSQTFASPSVGYAAAPLVGALPGYNPYLSAPLINSYAAAPVVAAPKFVQTYAAAPVIAAPKVVQTYAAAPVVQTYAAAPVIAAPKVVQTYVAAPVVQAPIVAPVAAAITKTVHYESKPTVVGYSAQVLKPDLGLLATPAELVTQQKVLAPARSVATITPQITQVQPELQVQKVPVDVPVAKPFISEIEIRQPAPIVAPVAVAAPAPVAVAAPAPAPVVVEARVATNVVAPLYQPNIFAAKTLAVPAPAVAEVWK